MLSKFPGPALKSVALTATMLLLVGTTAAAAAAVTTVQLTAQRMSTTLPDGTMVPMWGYCTNQASTDAGLSGAKLLNANICTTTTNGVATANSRWMPGPTIVVPAGNLLTVQLTNNIATGTSTSLVILGQIGGSAGNPTRDSAADAAAIAAHHGPVANTTWPANGPANVAFVPPTQAVRARAFAQEAAFGAVVQYNWTTPLQAGTYLYETGSHPSLQVPMGLYGVLVVTTPPTTTTTPTAAVTAAGQAFPGAYAGGPASLASLVNVPYDADATFLFSEIDVVQNAAVDAAAVANTSETLRWNDPSCRQSQQAAPAGYQVPCYPAAVNYGPTYFLVNGSPYDPSNPAASSAACAVPIGGNVLVRLVNAGLRTHSPGFIGSTLKLIAEDGNVAPGLPKLQSEVNMPAGKTYDAILVGNGAVPTALVEGSVVSFMDHALGLASGNKGKGGFEGYLVVTNTTLTGTATAASLNAAIGVGSLTPRFKTAAAAANPDNYTLAPNATTYAGNVLANDVGVTNVGIGSLPVGGFTAATTLTSPTLPYGSVTLNPDGTFTWSVATVGIPPASESFTYCGVPAGATSCALVTLTFEASGNAPTAVARIYDNSATTAYPSVVASVIVVPRGAGVLVGASGYDATTKITYPLTAAFPANTAAPNWVTLNPDGSFVATPCTTALPASCSFQFVAVTSNGVASLATTATVVFPAGSGLTVKLQDAMSGTALPADYGWIIEEDQTFHYATPGVTPPFIPGSPPPATLATSFHRSHSPILAAGCTGAMSCMDAQAFGGSAATPKPRSWPADVALDPTKYYYISILPGDASKPFVGGGNVSPLVDPNCGGIQPPATSNAPRNNNCGHTMGGASIAPLTAGTTSYAAGVTVKVEPSPLPPAQLSIYIFDDNGPTNGDPDANEHGLGGFEIVVWDVAGRSSGDPVGQVTYDVFNYPLTNALLGSPGCPNVYSPTPSGVAATSIYYAGKDLTGVVITCPNDPVNPANPSAEYALQGTALIKNVMPGRYDVIAHPGAEREGKGEIWHQLSTLEGTPGQDAFTKAGEPAYFQEFGPPGFHTFIGFVNPAEISLQNQLVRRGELNDSGAEGDGTSAGNGIPVPFTSVSGRVTSLHMSRPVMETMWDSASNASINQSTCFVAVNQAGETGLDIGFAVCKPDGTFVLTAIPVGSYQLVVWDKWLDQIIAFKAFQVVGTAANPLQPASAVTLGDIPVFSWFTRLQTSIFVDENLDGIRQPTEAPVAAAPVRVRFRDGSISNTLLTDASGNAVFSELFPLFNWYVVESDRTRFAGSGVNVTVDGGGLPDCVTYSATGTNTVTTAGNAASGQPCSRTGGIARTQYVWTNPATGAAFGAVPAGASTNTNRIDPGSTLFEGLQGFINQTQILDWGKRPLKLRETGGIQGMVVYASTRGFDDPSLEVQFMWEPGVPRVKMNLYKETQNADGTTGLTLVDWTTSNSWDDFANGTHVNALGATVPNLVCPGQDPNDTYLRYTLGTANQFKCYDGFHVWNQVQPAVYDGQYAFPTANCAICGAPTAPMLPSGRYVVEAVLPPGYQIVKEEDKNILIGDGWVAPAANQFGALSNIFIMPDQASLAAAYNPNNPNNSTNRLGFQGGKTTFPLCVGTQRTVPDFMSLFPNSGQVAPFAGATHPLCDRKEVMLNPAGTGVANFFLFSDTPRASHFTGLILDDAASEINSAAPDFGEKYALAYAPVSLRDFNGVEIERVYSDQWGTFNGVVFSTWQVNVPNPAGYSPNMLVTCMNDPGPIADPRGIPDPTTHLVPLVNDPLYNPSFSNFCYTNPFMPGMTVYLDTPVLPVAAFADGYSPPDCALPDSTPGILRVDGDKVAGKSGPWVAGRGATHPVTITARGDVDVQNPDYQGPSATTPPFNQKTIKRHYGFGAARGRVYLLQGTTSTELTVGAWSDTAITATIPNSVTVPSEGELQIVSATGLTSVDTVTLTIEPASPTFVEPVYKTATPTVDTGGISHPIQDALDAAQPGDLIIVDAGTYPEMVVMWKPVRLQGVGAASTTINAAKYPTQKLESWRPFINQLFGIDAFPGSNAGSIGTSVAFPQVDPLPTQLVTGGVILLEPTVLATEEGAGVTVLAKNLPASECTTPTAASTTLSTYWLPSPTTNNGIVTAVTETQSTHTMGESNFYCPANLGKPARIDGFSITGSDAGGGIFVNGWAHYLTISNNEIYGNASSMHGGLRVGVPFEETTAPTANAYGYTGYGYDFGIRIHHNVITHNGTVEATPGAAGTANVTGTGAGVSICTGTDGFGVSYNWICGNYSSGNGGGIGLLGFSNRGRINHNSVLFNQSFQQTASVNGGGISVEGDLTANLPANGTGDLTIDSNLIVGNFAEAGHGGGIQLAHVNGADVVANPTYMSTGTGTPWNRVTVTNNVITNNVAGWSGAGIYLVDTLNTAIMDNTIANNDTVGIAGVLFGVAGRPATSTPSPAGISTDLTSLPILQALTTAGVSTIPYQYSKPILFNDIIWHNRSFYVNAATGTAQICPSNNVGAVSTAACTELAAQATVGQCMAGAQYWDVGGVGDTSTNGVPLMANSHPSIVTSTSGDPGFVLGYCNGSRANPAFQFEPGQPFLAPAALAIGLTLDEAGNFVHLAYGPLSLTGNYRLAGGGLAVGNGRATSQNLGGIPSIPAAASDYAGNARPTNGRFDVGAFQFQGAGGGTTGSPVLAWAPAPLFFATGPSATSQTVIITNSGTGAATFGAIPVRIQASGAFLVVGAFRQTNTCLPQLAAGSSCTITVSYALPLAPATATMTASFVNPTSTLVMNLTGAVVAYNVTTGNGVAPNTVVTTAGGFTHQITFASAAAPRPAGTVGGAATAQPVTVVAVSSTLPLAAMTLGGANPGEFRILNNNCPVSPAALPVSAAGCTVNIVFAPTQAGTPAATLTVTPTNGAVATTVNLTGYATTALPGAYTLLPASLTFTNVPVGTTSAQSFLTLTNNLPLSQPLPLSSFAINGAGASQFALVPAVNGGTPACLATVPATGAGSICSLAVTFTPAAAATAVASVIGTNVAQTVSLTGTGIASSFTLSPSPALFASQGVGTSSTPVPVTLKNLDLVNALSGIQFAIGGVNAASFAPSSAPPGAVCGATLAANTSCSYYVTFTQQVGGVNRATLTVTASNPGSSPVTVALLGGPNSATLGGATGVFPNQHMGVPASQVFTYTNTGFGPITVAVPGGTVVSGTNAADFALTANTCVTAGVGATLAPAGTCSITVTFTPTLFTNESAALTVTDTAGGAPPQQVQLGGNGVLWATLTPDPTTFAPQQVGTAASAPLLVTYTNPNPSPTTITYAAAALGGTNPGDFAISANTCSMVTPLAAGANCQISVTFTPTAAGARTATLTVTDQAGGAPPTTATLNGSGAAPTATLTLNPTAFAAQQTGTTSAAQALTYTNTGLGPITYAAAALGGTNPGDFAISANTCSMVTPLAAGANCQISVTFTPTAAGARTATLSVTDAAGGTVTPTVATLNGTGQVPSATLTGAMAFGNETLGTTSAPSVFTYNNTGIGPITYSTALFTGTNPGDFAISANTCSMVTPIAAGTNCQISVTFTPGALGARSATLSVTDAANGAPVQSVLLTGTGVPPTATLVGTTFAPQQTGTTSAATAFTYTNTSNLALTIAANGIAASGSFAVAAGGSCVTGTPIISGGNCTINVTFTPTVVGANAGTLSVTDTAGGTPLPTTAALSGAGVAPSASLLPSPLTFSGPVGSTSAAQTLTYTNTGLGPITYASVALGGAVPGDYAISANTCLTTPMPLSPAQYCQISVTFTPTVAGVRNATVNVTDAAGGTPAPVSAVLNGTSGIPNITLGGPAVYSFGAPSGGNPVTVAFTLTNTAGANTGPFVIGTIVATTGPTTGPTGGSNLASYVVAPGGTCVVGNTVAAGGTCTVNVQFTPVQDLADTTTGTLTVTGPAAGTTTPTYTATLNMTGTGGN